MLSEQKRRPDIQNQGGWHCEEIISGRWSFMQKKLEY